MSWLTLSPEHVRDRLIDSEIAAYGDEFFSGTDPQRLLGIIAQVAGMIRGYVATCPRNVMGPAPEIPEECLWAAVAIVKHSLAAALPAMTDLQGELRRDEYRSALTYLENVAACKIEIEAPDDAELAEAGATTGRARYGGDPLIEIPLF